MFDNKCSMCGVNRVDKGYICKKCDLKLKEMSFLKKREGLYYLYLYSDLKTVIWDFKFKNRKLLSENIKLYMKKPIEDLIKEEKIDVIIPVPVSDQRRLERGYNQVEEILEACEIKFENIERIKNTEHMYHLNNIEKRCENIKGAFSIKEDYSGKKILIVDDIVTSGATMMELKKELESTQKVAGVILFTLTVVRKYFKK
ncbi:MAG: phosphoribosyltransferase family protein [Cetobacterium sp.]|uniref:ComF family protein n=1 Tax=Cetobacterium sp. TaxID=2071632 RepID=UPI002FCA44E6